MFNFKFDFNFILTKVKELVKSKFFWINIGAAVLAIIILWSIILLILKAYTNHGEAIKVPNLVGLYENEAEEAIKKSGLAFEIVDSVYMRDAKPGVIVEQTPKQGLSVKSGRIIFLTVNARQKKTIALPNLINVSQRQATYTLNSLGFNVGSVSVVPSEYSDMVLEVKLNGTSLRAGDEVPDGSTLSLVVGRNDSIYGGEKVMMPSLFGLSAAEAEKLITASNLVVGYVGFDNPQPANDKERSTYKVYKQIPEPHESVVPGKRVDIWLSKDGKKQQSQNKKNDDFFN